ncbi:MAG: AAA family ATPase, partial [Nitrospinales bacterium]
RLAAPFSQRVKNIMQFKNISEKEAEKLVFETDKDRKNYVNDYFDQDINDCAGYDIVLNTATTDGDTICKLIVQLMEMKKAKA